MPNRVRLLSVAAALPSRVRSSQEVEALIAERSAGFQVRPGLVEAMTGIRNRRVADDGVQCSDLAVEAARTALAKASLAPRDIDLLIFAAAGQDLIEPATAHIVQAKLGTRCQVFDVKNACNSFLNGIQLAESLILSGSCKTVLITTGEISSRAINWTVLNSDEFRRNLPAYTMGDAGAAAIVTRSDNGRGIFYRSFASRSEHWDLATVLCGGSMHPRGDDFTYLRGDGPRLKQVFVDVGPRIFCEMLTDAGVSVSDFDRMFIHQVSVPYHRDMLEVSGIPPEKVETTVEELGNLASASLPVAFSRAESLGTIVAGQRVLWLGMASGISVGVLMMDL